MAGDPPHFSNRNELAKVNDGTRLQALRYSKEHLTKGGGLVLSETNSGIPKNIIP